MILALRVRCFFGCCLREDCVRTIEIDQGASLPALHYAMFRPR